MASSRLRDGSLPQSTFYNMIHGARMSNLDASSRKERIKMRRHGMNASSALQKLRSRRLASTVSQEKPDTEEAPPQYKCVLKVPHYRDELSAILGDSEVPYFRLFDSSHDADTSNTQPTAEDRALFKQTYKEDPHSGSVDQDSVMSRAQRTNMTIHFGQQYTMDAWYRSAYPAEYTRRDYLSVCCYCLDYSLSDLSAERHVLKCSRRFPPGREIYRDGKLSIWEVDGAHANLYCQNLCLLAKSFLSSKSLYRDVQPFFFYVLTEMEDHGPRFVGYFSKQKIHSYYEPKDPIQCVSCIIALPFTQKQGYGQFLIDFSYLLTKTQHTTGSPETPLSSLGERAFRSYWKRTICETLNDHISRNERFSISSLSKMTGITLSHVVLTLDDLGWLKVSDAGTPTLSIDKDELSSMCARWKERKSFRVDANRLLWTPLFN